MTDNPTSPIDRSGIDAVIDLAITAADPHPLEEGATYAVAVPAGATVQVIDRDLDEYRDHPRRTTGKFTHRTAESLLDYLDKHNLPETELWADLDQGRITAVINAHRGTDEPAGWADHRAVLQLVHTPAWLAWEKRNGEFMSQVDFAEFIEQRTIDFVEPSGADVLELAQSFQAARRGKFESSKRLTSGETTLVYVEETTATAGRSGEIAIPDVLSLALQPYQGSPQYRVNARFRYRMGDGRLTLGYVLERPEDVLKDAFDSIVLKIADSPIGAPIFEGPAPA